MVSTHTHTPTHGFTPKPHTALTHAHTWYQQIPTQYTRITGTTHEPTLQSHEHTTHYTHHYHVNTPRHTYHTIPEGACYHDTRPITEDIPPFKDTPFQLNFSAEAASHNINLLAIHNNNLDDTLQALSSGTQLECGSEFRPTADLEPILCHHPLWSHTKYILDKGCTVALKPQNEISEHEDLKLSLHHGNHKGAVNQDDDLQMLLTKDVTHGYALPIDKTIAEQIKDGAWAPINIISQ